MFEIQFKDILGFMVVNKSFTIDILPHIQNLIAMPIKNRQTNYDVTSKFKKAVDQVAKEFEEQYKDLLEKSSIEKDVELKNGTKLKTKFKLVAVGKDYAKDDYVVKINGKKSDKMKIKEQHYDLKDVAEFIKEREKLMDVKVPFNCYKLKLSRFDNEELAWKDVYGNVRSVSLGDLEKFIENDLELIEEEAN